MDFISEDHKRFYEDHKDITSLSDDYAAMVYTFGIDAECRNHFKDLYNPKTRNINIDALHDTWQTSGSKKIMRLALNLFSWETAEGDDPMQYAPKKLFSGLDEKHRKGAVMALFYFA